MNPYFSLLCSIVFTSNTIQSQVSIDFITQDASCSGKGSIQVIATGGKSPYFYEIINNACGLNNKPLQSNQTFTGLSSCSYSVKVVDSDGRLATKEVIVGGNYIGPSASIAVDGCGFAVNRKNGSDPLKYSISTNGGLTYGAPSAQYIFKGLANGTYYIKIEDACNSVFISSATITLDTIEYDFWGTTDSIRFYNVRGGQGPYKFYIVTGDDTLKSNSYSFAARDIVKTCATKLIIQTPCGRQIDDFKYVDAENVCLNQTAGTAEFKVNVGVSPFSVYLEYPPNGGKTYSGLSINGLPKNQVYYSYSVTDRCGHHSAGSMDFIRYRPEFSFTTSRSCNELTSSQLNIIQNKAARKTSYTVECTSCMPNQRFNAIEKPVTINNLNSGKKTITIKDSCGSMWTCSSELLIPVEESCESIKLRLVNAFTCDNRPAGYSFSGDTMAVEMYYLKTSAGILIDSNVTGIFSGLMNGLYLVQARKTTCGLIQGNYSRNIVLQAPFYYVNPRIDPRNKACQQSYFLNIESKYAPYTLSDSIGRPIFLNSNTVNSMVYYEALKPGKYIIKSLLNCWQKEINLPLLTPKIKKENITVCPAGGSIEISGGKSSNQWREYFNALGLPLGAAINSADFYSLTSRYSTFNYDTARHTYYNIEPGKSYTIYLHSFAESTNFEDNTCPIDSFTFTAPLYTPPTLLSDLSLKCDHSNSTFIQLKVNHGTKPYSLQEINCTNHNNIGTISLSQDSIIILNTTNLNTHCYKVTDVCQNSSNTESSIGDLNSNIQILKNCDQTMTFYFSFIPGADYNWKNKSNAFLGNQNSITIPDPEIGEEIKLNLIYKGCTIAKSLIIDSLIIKKFDVGIIANKDLKLCAGDSILLTASILNGIGPFQFRWSNGVMSDHVMIKSSGFQTLWITNGLGCTDSASLSISISDPLKVSVVQRDINCFGDSTGLIRIDPVGGFFPYIFSWSTGAIGNTKDSISKLAAGSYKYTVTDNIGCTIADIVTLAQNPKLILTSNSTIASCTGSIDGTAEVISAGGLPGYTYRWNTGSTTNQLQHLNPGIYTVSVTDRASCTSTIDINIEQKSIIPIQRNDTICPGSNIQIGHRIHSLTGIYLDTLKTIQGCDSIIQTNLMVLPFEVKIKADRPADLCAGDSISLMASVVGEFSPLMYSWNNGSKEDNIWINKTGIQTVQVYNAFGCTVTASLEIRVGSPLSIDVNKRNIDCFGASSGIIKIVTTGGLLPYKYLWATGERSDSVSALPIGQYSVTVTDIAGCSLTEGINLSQNQKLELTTNVIQATCNLSMDGSVSVFPSGGVAEYHYSWNNGSSQNSITKLNPGAYQVTVTDKEGCKISTSLEVLYHAPIIHQRNDTICSGASLIIGASRYTISGNYRDTLKTLQGCDSIEMTQLTVIPFNVSIFADKKTNLCAGDSIHLTASVTGGLAPLDYLWTTGPRSNSIYIKSSGMHRVIIRNGLGCLDTAEISIMVGDSIKVKSTVKPIACFGDSTGSLKIQPYGGFYPYRYLWSNGTVSDSIISLSYGQYSVTITDSAECSITEYFNFSQHPKLILNSKVSLATCSTSNDGIAEVIPSGGLAGYKYEWNNGDKKSRLTNLNPGLYSVTVTDQASCRATAQLEVNKGPEIIRQRSDTICSGASLHIGASIYNESGTYRDTLKTIYGCDSIIISRLTIKSPVQYTITPTDPKCNDERNGTISIFDVSNTTPYIYEIDGKTINGSKAENLSSGNYNIKISDAYGCYTERTIALINPKLIDLYVGKDTVIQYGDSIKLKAITNIDTDQVKTIRWISNQQIICSNCIGTTIKPTKDILLKIELETINGCTAVTQLIIKVNADFKVFAPNILILNLGSGHSSQNSIFTLYSKHHVTELEYLRIFDRFGALIFEVKNAPMGDPGYGWNGMYKGKLVPAGVYVFLAKVKFTNEFERIVSGDITVVN
ncbi:MAG: gliding motility-associated C-terminal domain-containing protein [Saprospiraceae bacterium]|nr:gliding motility-associated C-terminal domain-containing protein [Saprospiraceae bacterium]